MSSRRAKNKGSGIIVGIVMFIASFFVLWINEAKFVENLRQASFIEKNVVSITGFSADNNRKLVHYSGKIKTAETLSDEFVAVNTPALSKKVEMYQWDERSCETDTKRCRYEKTWSSRSISSSNFEQSAGHYNPPMQMHSQDFKVLNATVGEFRLDKSIIDNLTPELELANLPPKNGYTISDNKYYSGNAFSPSIGDYRISYKYIPLNSDISIISTQYDKLLTAFKNKKYTIAHVRNGVLTADGMVAKFREESSKTAMIFRFVGFLLMLFGLLCVVSPLTAILKFFPPLQSLAETLSSWICLVIALALSAITIAIAWISVRPEIAIPVIAAAAAGVYFAFKQKKKVRQVPPSVIE